MKVSRIAVRLVVQWGHHTHVPRDLPEMWAVIDVRSGEQRPLSAAAVVTDPTLRRIVTFSADSARRGLGHISLTVQRRDTNR